MASHPPAQCCTVGVKHEGEPTGKLEKIDNDSIEIYIAEPPKDTAHQDAAILFLPDVIGIWQNSKLMADQFAANGYLTVLVDLFNGDQLALNRPADFNLMKWIAEGSTGSNPHTMETIDPIVEKAIAYLQNRGIKKIGSVGYCFGAKYTVRFAAKGKGINVAYLAHPSFVEEDELKAIKAPISIAAADTDSIFPTEKRHRTEELLLDIGQEYQINLYGKVSHGFSVRCDPTIKYQKFAKEKAFFQAVNWFDEYLL